MKKFLLTTLLFTTLICCNHIFGQAFLKTYTDPTNRNASVSFECITQKTDSSGNLYIAGHIGDTITVFKMSTSGTILATYKIKGSPVNSKVDAIMLVLDNNPKRQKILVLGNIQSASGNQGFMFRLDRANGTVDWFRQSNLANPINYWDMTDKTGSFYIVSGERTSNGSALILKVNKANGSPSVALNYLVNGLEDPEAVQLSGTILYATGRYSLPGGTGSGDGFRSCFTRINTATAPHYTHLGTYYYIAPEHPVATARMYSTDILVVNSKTAVIVGHGDDNSDANAFKNLNITKVNATTGVPIWSKKYDNPSAASDGSLTEIRLDNANKYTVMGFSMNPNSGALDKATLWSVNPSNGNLFWNRQYNLYRRTANNSSTYGYGFTIVDSSIYAVGQNSTSGITKGVLLKVSTANGNITHNDGTDCYDTLNIVTSDYNFCDSIPVDTLSSTISAINSAKQVLNIKMNDSLICGNTSSCNCSLHTNVDGGSLANQLFNCADTIPLSCGLSYFFHPSLSCTDTNIHVSTGYIKDSTGTIPSWAVDFHGTGGLGIPDGVSGNYTLTYYWGANGGICDSCKYNIKIVCCPPARCTFTASIKYKSTVNANCADTVPLYCHINYSVTPNLSCPGNTGTHITQVTLTDANSFTPSWANSFIANNGAGTLALPAGIVPGIYKLTYYWGVDVLTCGSCTIYLKINCCDNFSVSAGPDITTCCSSSGVQLNATASGGVSPYAYSWSPITGLSNPNIANPIAHSTGTYVVTVTDAFGCIRTDTVKITYSGVNCCRITDNKTKAQAYPNPFINGFTLKIPMNAVADIKVTNVYGTTVETKRNASGTIQLGAKLTYGTYTVAISYKDGSKEQIKVIKNPD